MSKYTNLTEWLSEQSEDSIVLTFTEVEKLLVLNYLVLREDFLNGGTTHRIL